MKYSLNSPAQLEYKFNEQKLTYRTERTKSLLNHLKSVYISRNDNIQINLRNSLVQIPEQVMN